MENISSDVNAYLYTNSQAQVFRTWSLCSGLDALQYIHHPCQKAHPIVMVWWQSAVLRKNLLNCHYDHRKLQILLKLSGPLQLALRALVLSSPTL